jgi:hypothetical protein
MYPTKIIPPPAVVMPPCIEQEEATTVLLHTAYIISVRMVLEIKIHCFRSIILILAKST